MTSLNYLGRGLKYPITFGAGKLRQAAEIQSVISAVLMLFATPKGRRFMLPEYGSNLYQLLFEPCNEVTAQIAAIYAKEAILEWIPRVEYVSVDAEVYNEQSRVDLNIEIVLVNSANRLMMIYPFYLNNETVVTNVSQIYYEVR